MIENINCENKELFLSHQLKHLSDGGGKPMEFAITELIKYSLENKNYKLYLGGGYDTDGKRLQLFDIVCYFSLTGDHYMMIVVDDSDGDSLSLITCNDNGELKSLNK